MKKFILFISIAFILGLILGVLGFDYTMLKSLGLMAMAMGMAYFVLTLGALSTVAYSYYPNGREQIIIIIISALMGLLAIFSYLFNYQVELLNKGFIFLIYFFVLSILLRAITGVFKIYINKKYFWVELILVLVVCSIVFYLVQNNL